jgi:hypothetical protein
MGHDELEVLTQRASIEPSIETPTTSKIPPADMPVSGDPARGALACADDPQCDGFTRALSLTRHSANWACDELRCGFVLRALGRWAGRDRTCDFGIKSPSEQAATCGDKLK